MKGDLADITARLQKVLPSGWFPPEPGSRVWLTMLGFSAAFTRIWNQLQFIQAQTRTATSSEGWLDLKAWDYFGWWVTRLPGEADAVLLARMNARLLEPANTREAIRAALVALTGAEPRIMEPWNPQDVGVIDGPGMYLDVDSTLAPGRIVDPSMRNQFFVETIVPTQLFIGTNPIPALDAASYVDVWNAALIDLTSAQSLGSDAIYSLLLRLKAEGVVAWVNLIAPTATGVTQQMFTLDSSLLDDPNSLLA